MTKFYFKIYVILRKITQKIGHKITTVEIEKLENNSNFFLVKF